MYFNKTLEDWIGFKIDKRTKFDLTISSGLALLQHKKKKKNQKLTSKKRCFSGNIRSSIDLLYLQNTSITQ